MQQATKWRVWDAGVTPPYFACCVIGLGLYWAWTFFSFNPPVASAYPVALMHVTSMAGASVSFVAVALGRRALSPLHERRGILLACGAVTAAATPPYMLGGLPVWAACLGAAASGAAIAVVVCAFAEAFTRMTPAALLGGTSLVFMAAYVTLIALAALADVAGRASAVAVSCALPLASAALLALCPRTAADEGTAVARRRADAPDVPASSELSRLPWRTFVVIACMYFAIGGIRVYVERATGDLTMNAAGLSVGIALLAVALVASILTGRRAVAPLGAFYKVAMPLVAVAYVILLTTGESHPGTLGFIAQMVCLVVECLCWVLIVDSARENALSALLSIGLGRFVVQLGMSLGEFASVACAANVVPLGTATVFLLVLSFVFLFSDRETSVRTDAKVEDKPVQTEPQASVQLEADGATEVVLPASDGLKVSWNLTEREQTILDLWVTSHGLKSIAEELSLSESTVKTHVRHIYEKAGVHSRAELIKLMDRNA